MTTLTWFCEDTYANFLKRFNFNEEQIEFLTEQRHDYESMKRSAETESCDRCGNSKEVSTFDHDTYERDMWYTMNRSGLFENGDDNKTGITNWNPSHTRIYITEVNY